MIKTIIFDIGNVLMKFDYGPYIKNLLKDDAVIEKVNDAVWRTGYWNELDLGHEQEKVFSKMLDAGPDCREEIRSMLENVGDCIGPMDYAKPWIRSLKERGFQVLFLSNYSEFIMKSRPDVLDFLPLMDGGVFSCYVGQIKPDPAIYRTICDKYDLTPEECVFLDDNKANIEAAGNFGMKGIHFVSFEQAKEDLEELLKDQQESIGI